jgi:hypothetical protein
MDPKEELKLKLREKINQIKQKNYKMPKKDQIKMEKDIHKEKKEFDTDKRLTPLMRKWFIEAMKTSPNIDVKSPSYILNNKEEEKIKFYKFLTNFIDDVKVEVDLYKNDMMKVYDKIPTLEEKIEYKKNVNDESKKKFKSYFSTPYIIYMSLMTDINVYEDLLINNFI